ASANRGSGRGDTMRTTMVRRLGALVTALVITLALFVADAAQAQRGGRGGFGGGGFSRGGGSFSRGGAGASGGFSQRPSSSQLPSTSRPSNPGGSRPPSASQ